MDISHKNFPLPPCKSPIFHNFSRKELTPKYPGGIVILNVFTKRSDLL